VNIPSLDVFNHICKTLLSKRWIFAKTMPHAPHWYTLRREWYNDELFNEIVTLIRRYGYKERYGRTWYTKFNINGMKYWTMGAPIPKTILINRAHVDARSPYDDIADRYDSLFCDELSERENRDVFALLPQDVGSVLDIGCGSGLLLDYISPAQYTGIDPSGGMLDLLKAKHPRYTEDVIKTHFETFFDGIYDTIVALFGAASYIHPSTLSRIETMLEPGGKYLLMFYKPGYYPLTYTKTGVEIPHFTGGEEELGGEIIEYGNFLIATGEK